jgi:hypothetical protein
LSVAIDEFIEKGESESVDALIAPIPVENFWSDEVADGAQPHRVLRAETCFEGQSVVVQGGQAIELKGNRYLVTTNPENPHCFFLVYFSEDIALENPECRVELVRSPAKPEAARIFKVYLEFQVREGDEMVKHQKYLDVEALTFAEAVQKAKQETPEVQGTLAAVDASEPEVTFD